MLDLGSTVGSVMIPYIYAMLAAVCSLSYIFSGFVPYISYSLRSILLFANVVVSKHILVVDTSVLVKSNMDRREYLIG
jgi:hypothetical protein